MQIMNLFTANNFFLYPLKSTENMRFFETFRGPKRGVMWHEIGKYFNLFAACM